MAELIFEIGCEEIPAGYIAPALEAMAASLAKDLDALGVEHGRIQTFGTPRRIGVVIPSLAAEQPDRVEKVLGPKVELCFGPDGAPTKTALGFAKSRGVAVEDLEKVETPKGACVQATVHTQGQRTKGLLPELLKKQIPRLPFPKSMKWASHDETFVRPILWILAVFDGETVPFDFAGVQSGDTSRGHRFMRPEPFAVRGIEAFFAHLSQAYVIADPEERRKLVRQEATRLADSLHGKLRASDALTAEVANLVEYPFGEIGSFDAAFLAVPKEVLISSMTKHQRYFPVLDDKGRLLSHFVLFSNTQVADPKVTIAGNERVLRARLSDARFFYEEDRKKRLADFAPGLAGVTFEERLGTIAEKVQRIQEHVRFLVSHVNAEALEDALRAAALAKADLLTSVVYEFPDLQGAIGSIYAELDGEKKAVCEAIEQHYWPRFAEDALPESDVAALVALADKMDTVAGCFGVGLIPSGAADPYALRRQSLGVLRILVQRGYRVPLQAWIQFAVSALGSKLRRPAEATAADIAAFIEGRYRNWRVSDYPADVVDAVVGAGFNFLPEAEAKLAALVSFMKRPEFQSLAIAFKRVMNILKQRPQAVVTPNLFADDSEHQLWARYQQVRDKAGVELKQGHYGAALEAMAELKAPVDKLFDDVMVMAEDKAVRDNRLALLGHLADLFLQVADFRRLQTE
ncbi:MAG: glycine--tRNA ligase subunit beta [Myxococcales bacterium]|nr:MAG: glycine--tRNA ligase subunit beta [Myxococcales bacterium]